MTKVNNTWKLILLFTALGLWIFIAYSIYQKLNQDGETGISKNAPINSNVHTTETDSLTLILTYPDPFLKQYYNHKKQRSSHDTHSKAPTENKVKWPEIIYHGIIVREKKSIALLNIDGTDVFHTKGQIIHNVMLLNMSTDSVLVEFKKEKKYIKRSK